ncbi:MAG: YbhB/YbcL family Raf kinase inhibitor-like protein [Candidatus Nanoarchaeia archaeon]
MEITSVFEQEAVIPKRYTCDGENVNPPLEIKNLPENTETLVLIVDDPDAPSGDFVHWVVFNIPPREKIEEATQPQGIAGKNDFNKLSYGGPCPPSGKHRYFFKIYALDCKLDLKQGATKQDVEAEMEEHIIEQAQLVGLYFRE